MLYSIKLPILRSESLKTLGSVMSSMANLDLQNKVFKTPGPNIRELIYLKKQIRKNYPKKKIRITLLHPISIKHSTVGRQIICNRKCVARPGSSWVFKDHSSRHFDLRRRENRFLGADVGVESGFHAGVGRNAD